MPRVFFKNILQEIRHSLGRFFSILSIVAIGVAFFGGIKASAPDMKNSADSYFDEYNVQDIQVYSTLGLKQDDIDKIKKIDGVEDVQPSFFVDTITHKESSQLVIKVFSLPDTLSINKIRMVDGRLPEKENECIIMAPSATDKLFGNFEIGDEIDLSSGIDTPLSDTLKNTKYTIVGTCYNPNYLSYQLGSSNVGNGSVSSFIYVPQDNVLVDYYTEIDVTVKGAKDVNMYSDAYFDIIKPVKKEIKNIAGDQIDAQIKSLQDELNDAKRKAKEEFKKAWDEIESGQQKIEQAKKEISANEPSLANAKIELDNGWKEYNDGLKQIEPLSQVIAAIEQIEQGEAQLPELIAQRDYILSQIGSVENAKSQLNILSAQKTIVEGTISQLEAWLASGTLKGKALEAVQEQLASAKTSLETLNQSIQGLNDAIAGLEQLNAGIAQIEEASTKKPELIQNRDLMLEAKKKLDEAYATLSSAQKEYDAGLAKLTSAKAEVEANEKKLNDGQKELESKEEEAEEEFKKAQQQIDDLEGKWIVLDRNSHYSYRDYGACADRMDGIAKVFPVFFFLVAALVCMTTMTRMVDEQRSEIGTMKALGYSKLQISSKYVIYAASASIFGSALGCLVGMIVFPLVIFTAWNLLYNLPGIVFVLQPGLILLSAGSVTGVTLLATLFSIYGELIEVPSQLMRPKAAKAGKKIFLEFIPFIWNRLNFLQKVCARNLFRYKKRFYMTIIGIAGCSALLVSGFGINDSIGDIVTQQYGAIYHYNASVSTDEDSEELRDTIGHYDGVENLYEEQQMALTTEANGKEMTITCHIIDEAEKFPSFVTLKSTSNGEELPLADNKVYISQKIAMMADKDVGDTITVKDANEDEIQLTIDGIYENYVEHHLYVTKDTYDTWDTVAKKTTTYLLKNKTTDSDFEKDLGNKIMSNKDITSVVFYSSLEKNFKDMIKSLSMIVVVLVISAALLAFVVLYNLSNVNISERIREIATIKVLGFLPNEVSSYVNRESTILTIIGAIAGLGIGIGLHHLIMNLAEMDDIMFGRTIKPISYVISFGLTILFNILINLFMRRKLNKIQMVESLKAVE